MNQLQRLRELRRNYVKQFGKRTIRGLGDFLGRQSLIGDHSVFDASQFPWVAVLEDNWRQIRAELESLLAVREHLPSFHEISPDQKRISKGDNWKTFVLYGFGHRSERNCQRCPETARALAAIPGLQTAFFSILSPGYHIPAHRGVTKGVIRCHLALKVPRQRDQCAIQVGDQTCCWEEGKCLVFDDTYEHEVWNNTDQDRAVLLLDINRPMRLPGRLLSRAFMRGIKWTAYFKDARKNQAAWEDRFETAVQRANALQEGQDN